MMKRDAYNVLTIDDDSTILDAYASILVPYQNTSLEDAVLELEKLHNMEQSVIEPTQGSMNFKIYQAHSGLEGVDIFSKKYQDGLTIPVCIVDMRMPNGIDGLETSLRLKQIDPDVHIIIATAYSDRTNKEILDSLKSNTYYVRKPFNSEEIYQLVYSLSLSYYATKTIQRLNSDLTLKIEEELEKNRQKDLILFEQAKFAAMGEMIGNIAHQWRQPLSIISMLFQKINRMHQNNSLGDEEMSKVYNQAIETTQYMSQTIDDFRGQFKSDNEKEIYDLASAIKNSVDLLEPSFNSAGVAIDISSCPDLQMYGYPQDLKQVLLNILNNAKDAISSKSKLDGKITLIVKHFKDEQRVSIQICDNGGGIDKLHIDKIFEPYFTTKHKSQGTGIGLYMSKKIIEERMGGTIMVQSDGASTCFSIIFPIQHTTKG